VRRVSDTVKRLAGTDRADRRRTPPRPRSGVPRARPGLPRLVAAERARLVTALSTMPGFLTLADESVLELASSALAEYRVAERVVIEEGSSYACTTASGAELRRARPEVQIAAEAWRRALAGLKELGLSPASRSKIDVEAPLPANDLDRFRAQRDSSVSRFFSPPSS